MNTVIDAPIKVTSQKGFVYNVLVRHWPINGISIAYYNGEILASREYGKFIPPITDNDKEWELWEEGFQQWADDAVNDLILDCEKYFNKNETSTDI